MVVTTAPLTALTHRVPRKSLMLVTLGVFAVANLLAAIAPAYGWLMAARILGGLAHGLFWAVTNPYTARLVPRHQLTRAISVTAAGGSAAFVLGVPLGTALGHAIGWRLAFATMGGVILLFLLLVLFLLPPVSHIVPLATGEIPLPLRHDRTIPVVVIICVTVLLLSTGQNTFYTYIAPWLTQVGGLPPSGVPAVLFVFGAAGAVGLAVAGVFGDRFPRGGADRRRGRSDRLGRRPRRARLRVDRGGADRDRGVERRVRRHPVAAPDACHARRPRCGCATSARPG